MNRVGKLIVGVVLGMCTLYGQAAMSLELKGGTLTIEEVARVAREGEKVEVAPAAMEMAELSFKILLQGAAEGQRIYGLTTGVGLNKDQTVIKDGKLTDEVRSKSEEFNRNLLIMHATAVEPVESIDVVRAAMLIRANGVLSGSEGLQPAILKMYVNLLNGGVTPVMPSRGSVGESDITTLPHIGLTMMGIGEAWYNGERMAAAHALKMAGLAPVTPYAKDALTILSSNAHGAAAAVLLHHDISRLIDTYDTIFGLSLEGLNGNVAPFLPTIQSRRPYEWQMRTAEQVLAGLEGSYLWQEDAKRRLQDPLSFRDYSQIVGAMRDTLASLGDHLAVQINHGDTNPTVVPQVRMTDDTPSQIRKYYVKGEGEVYGMINPGANFDPAIWTLDLQKLSIAMANVSTAIAQRIVVLGDDKITSLTRFLRAKEGNHAYPTAQKTISSLMTENLHLSMPLPMVMLHMAGGIEDVGNNTSLVCDNLQRQLDNLYYLASFELLHAAQAVNLRLLENNELPLGKETKALFTAYRQVVPFSMEDRQPSIDVESGYNFLKSMNR